MKQKSLRIFKIFLVSTLPAFIIAAILLFPFSDLSDLVSTKVSQLTQNQLYIQFEDLGIKILPSPGVKLKKVTLETPYTPRLKLDSLSLSPSIAGLLSFKPGVSIQANGLYNGNLDLNTKGGDKTEKDVLKQKVVLQLENLLLEKLHSDFKFPINVSGKLNLEAAADFDPSLGEQPEADIDLRVSAFKILGGNIDTGVMGMIQMPPISLSDANVKLELKQGKLLIKSAQLGKGNDHVKIKINGQLSLRLQKRGHSIQPKPGAYDLNVEIDASKQFQEDFALYLTFLEAYKKSSSAPNALYKFRISASGVNSPANLKVIE